MAALVLSQLALYLAAGLIGLALGWRLHAAQHAILVNAAERDIEELRKHVENAHVRRVRAA